MTTSEQLFRVFSKATTAEADEIRRSANWAVARRGWLHVFQDRLQMGDWVIPYASIQQATLFRLKTLIGGYVLRVTTATETYQFGMNPWALRRRRLPFPHDIQDTPLHHSALTIVLRFFLLICLFAWLAAKLLS